MRTIGFAFICCSVLLFHGVAYANTIESVEWLCLRADAVFVGHITDLHDVRGRGKNRQLMWFTLRGVERRAPHKKRDYALGIRVKDPKQLKTYQKNKTPLLIFAGRTIQAFSPKKNIQIDTWPLWKHNSKNQWLIPLKQAKSQLILSSMKRVQKAAFVPALCQKVVKQAKQSILPILHRVFKNKPQAFYEQKRDMLFGGPNWRRLEYLEYSSKTIPSTHPLFKQLACKQTCTLRIPKL